jgi:putative oxidoreductase
MATLIMNPPAHRLAGSEACPRPSVSTRREDVMKALAPIGRLLFSAIFIFSGVNHFIHVNQMVGYVQSVGIPAPRLAILGSGALIVVCGLCVLLGVFTRLCAALLAVFLVATAFTIHRFWGLADPQAAMEQMSQFMKNIAMTGGALILTYFGPGPFSLRARKGVEAPPPGVAFPLRQRPQQ